MKLFLLLLCTLLLSGCSYIGATEEILISSPYQLSVHPIETFDQPPLTTPADPKQTTEGASTAAPVTDPPMPAIRVLILSKSTKKIHYYEGCPYVANIAEQNRDSTDPIHEEALIAEGYTICSWCHKHKPGAEEQE